MDLLKALLLGIVEGLTEYLPVSSTGHLLLVSRWLAEQSTAFVIVIQFGAILAVLAEYRAKLLRWDPQLFTALAIGFVPTGIAGFLLRKIVKAHLTGPLPIACALLAGGVIMIAVERIRASRKITGETGIEHVTPARAFAIGVGQCFSLWPGTSRSMCTIVAGQLVGLSTATAAEFSFLLGLPTLGAATMYEGWKSREELFRSSGSTLALAIGLVTSFAVAWIVVRTFIRYLKSHGLEAFGIYRIVLGAAILAVIWHG
jgi:undecaprenyl-diphosphatase